MYCQILKFFFIIMFSVNLAGCNLNRSKDEQGGQKGVKVEITKTTLSAGQTVTAAIHNLSSEEISIFQSSLHSQLTKNIATDNWIRLFKTPPGVYSDWYIHLKAGEKREYSYSYDDISSLILINKDRIAALSENENSINGEYQFIFDIVHNNDYEDLKKFCSISFWVK